MKSAPRSIASTATTRPASSRSRVARQPADRPFGEHAKPFLHAFIIGEAGAEDLEALRRAVEIGQQMDADLVRQQGVERGARA